MDLEAYVKSVLCSTLQAKNTALNTFKKQYNPIYSALQNYTQLVQGFHVSKQMLSSVVSLTENCNQSQLDDLREYVKNMPETRHEVFVPVASATLRGLGAFERWLKDMFSSYNSRLKERLSEMAASITIVEITVTDFVTANEFSFKWQTMIRFIPVFIIALILICITTLLSLIVYSISTFCEDPANSNSLSFQTRSYRKGAKLLNYCGFAAMLTSACIFAATGLLLYIGYSSVLICNSFVDHNFEEYDHISLDDPEVNSTSLELRAVFMKCRRLLPFYEAMQLERLLSKKPLKNGDRPPSSADLNRKLDSALSEDLSSIFGKHSDHLMEALKLGGLGADKCVGDKSQSFNDTITQIEAYARIIDEARAEMFANKSNKYLENLEKSVRSYKDVSDSDFIATFDDALRQHSPDCSELAAAVEVWRPFCYTVPQYFQGTWVVCGITAIVSIHVMSAVFKASDFMMPTEHFRPYRKSMRLSAEGSKKVQKRSADGTKKTRKKSVEGSAKKRTKSAEGTRKKSTKRQGRKDDQNKSVLRNVLGRKNDAPPRVPADVYDSVPRELLSC
ncbi:hypothetical protein Y032_0060g3181 [Ancylostoma ceylanicum]|nr:hypothetical protein Y032_0060g3181 [Ancylostoma ceylanicum]